MGLSDLYASEEIQSFFNILSEEYLNLSRIEIALNSKREISKEDSEKFDEALLQLQNHEPIQYIIGKTEFYGLTFNVNKHTLIPRPETEELVEWILNSFSPPFKGELVPPLLREVPASDGRGGLLLDIGTGSGCIAVSLAKNLPNAKVSALDISEEALKIAKLNAKHNEVEVNFYQEDILTTEQLPQEYDVIVSNPPYVREQEKQHMRPNVLKFEPESALYVSNGDPLVFYRAISQLAKIHLKPNGKLFFEINEYLSDELTELLKNEGYTNIEVKKDIFGKDRMLRCQLDL